MLTIRLSRIGKKNKPMYRLIISEKSKDPYADALEVLGSYNPYTKELQAKNERIQYWISQGAGTSPTVNNLLIKNGVIQGEAVRATKIKKSKQAELAKKEAEKKAPKAEEKPEEAEKAEETSAQEAKQEEQTTEKAKTE
jgi:small subunit ribosomal protein S16